MKKVFVVLVLVALLVTLTACATTRVVGNRAVYGSDVQTFHYAYIYLGGNKIAEGNITQWRDYEDSDTIQVMIGGKYYLTHYTNVIMVADPDKGSIGYDWEGGYN